MVTINLKQMDSVSLGFEPISVLAFQERNATDVAASKLPKKLGHSTNLSFMPPNHHQAWFGQEHAFSAPGLVYTSSSLLYILAQLTRFGMYPSA